MSPYFNDPEQAVRRAREPAYPNASTERLRSSLPAIVCPECGVLILDSLGGSHTAGELMLAHAHDCPGCEPCRECNGLEALCNECGGCGFVPSSTVKERD